MEKKANIVPLKDLNLVNRFLFHRKFYWISYEIKKLRGDAQKRIWKLPLRDMRFAQSVQVPQE